MLEAVTSSGTSLNASDLSDAVGDEVEVFRLASNLSLPQYHILHDMSDSNRYLNVFTVYQGEYWL